MIYYRVKPQYDGYRRRHGHATDCTTLINGEIYTPAEVQRYGLDVDKLEQVNARKCKSYRFFGGRFNSDLQKEGETHDERQK